MSRELRTYAFTVVVEPAGEMWHAYCPTLLAYGKTLSYSGANQVESGLPLSSKPFTVKFNQRLMPDDELIEFVCQENEISSKHFK